MIVKIPFDWNDPAQAAKVNKYKISNPALSGYLGYYPCDFKLFGRNITHTFGGKTYRLEVSPKGNEPINWISGILDNKDNIYSTYVTSVKENPKYSF